MTYEFDIYSGYASTFSNLNYDIGSIHYANPDCIDDVVFTETYANINYQHYANR